MVHSVSTTTELHHHAERGHHGLRALVLGYVALMWIAVTAAAVALPSTAAGLALVAAGIAHTAMTPSALRFMERELEGVIRAPRF
jgi:uncharacterized membrane protein HdeD (DUF308 family)